MANAPVVGLKKISDLQGKHFYIDNYQRGYRWSYQQVLSMLQDIREFTEEVISKDDISETDFYCLQSVIVTKDQNDQGEIWKVIDGQQRLTTIYLILIYLRKGDLFSLPFDIKYNNKAELEQCFEELKKLRVDMGPKGILEKYSEDIDCYYLLQAYDVIYQFFGGSEGKCSDLMLGVSFRDKKAAFCKVLCDCVRIIWYELQTDGDESKEIEEFTNVNMGKIRLTNAELVKALFLSGTNDEDAIAAGGKELLNEKNLIALQWDRIESRLQDDRFWYFLVNRKYSHYVTRMDFVFDVMATVRNMEWQKNDDISDDKYQVTWNASDEQFSFMLISHYLDYLHDHGRSHAESIHIAWKELQETFNILADFYNDRRLYHLLGVLICISEEKFLTVMAEIVYQYKYQEKSGDNLMTYLKSRINKAIFGVEDDAPALLTRKDLENTLEKLSYSNANNLKIRGTLLLHNVAAMDQLKHSDSRFSFFEYKGKSDCGEVISWDIEHINPSTEDIPKDNTSRGVWLIDNVPQNGEVYNSLSSVAKDDLNSLYEKLFKGTEKTKDNIDKSANVADLFTKVYTAVIRELDDSLAQDASDAGLKTNDGISNLTLLDSTTNRSYKNNIFYKKRLIIIEKYSTDVFVPICTRGVFLKTYGKPDNLIKWDRSDRDAYLKDMASKISVYLNLQDQDQEQEND